MKEWFGALEKREQNLVLMLGGVLIIALVYFAIFQPLAQQLERAQQGLKREQKLLVWVEKNAVKLIGLRASSGAPSASNQGSLEQIVNSSARRYKLTINRLQPQTNKLQVTLDKAPFAVLLQWIQELQLNYGVKFEIAEFRPEGTPGMVKTRLVASK